VAEFKPKVWMHCPLCGKPSPMPDPDKREWVGLTDDDFDSINAKLPLFQYYRAIEAMLKEKNCG